MLSQRDIQLAKKRIWNRMEKKLSDRGLSTYQPVLNVLRSQKTPVSNLKRVQFKEHLLDLLPDRAVQASFFSKRLFASTALLSLLGVLFMPVLELAPQVSASASNMIEVVEGEVWVNGSLVTEFAAIQPGDSILTGEGSMAHLYFLDDSRLTLGPDSQVDIVDTQIDSENRAETQVALRLSSGRAWVQVLNLVSQEATFTLDVPQGSIRVDSRASFDVEVGDETHIGIARNLVNVNLNQSETSYEGVLGQGAELWIGEDIQSGTLEADIEEEVWWSFNLAYGKSYARELDENYKQEAFDRAVILPGNPLYFLKTFRESIQVSLTFSESAKQDLLVQQAENRLNEAQVLLAKGETEAAEEVLAVYQNTVEEALENSDNEAMLAMVEETQKEVSVSQEVDESTSILEEHLTSSSATVTSDLSQKAEAKLLSASQKLERVPDLIANGDFDQALIELSSYQSESFSVLTDLEGLSLEEREALISTILDQKLKDIQLLRVVASMPELQEMVDLSDTLLEQLSMMVLSLREKELSELSSFFESTDYDVTVQYDMYIRLKDSAEITPELSEQFETVEQQLMTEPSTEPVVDLTPVEETPEQPIVEDPRFKD